MNVPRYPYHPQGRQVHPDRAPGEKVLDGAAKISRAFAKPPFEIQDGKIGKPYENGNLWQNIVYNRPLRRNFDRFEAAQVFLGKPPEFRAIDNKALVSSAGQRRVRLHLWKIERNR